MHTAAGRLVCGGSWVFGGGWGPLQALPAGPVIGGRAFDGGGAFAVDLSAPNRTAEMPMDLIVGYPTLRRADWLMDFPARHWAVMS